MFYDGITIFTLLNVQTNVGLLLSFDIIAIFYGFKIIDMSNNKTIARNIIAFVCICLTINTTAIGFMASLLH